MTDNVHRSIGKRANIHNLPAATQLSPSPIHCYLREAVKQIDLGYVLLFEQRAIGRFQHWRRRVYNVVLCRMAMTYRASEVCARWD